MMKAIVSSALLLVHAAGEQTNAQAFATKLLFGTAVAMPKAADFTVTSSKGGVVRNGQYPKKSDGSRFPTICDGSTSESVFNIEGEGSFTAESSSNYFVVTSTANEVSVVFTPDVAAGTQHDATVTLTDEHGGMFTFMVGGAVSKGMLAVYDQASDEVVFAQKIDFGKNTGFSKILSLFKSVIVKNVDLQCPVTFGEISVTTNNEKYGDGSYKTINRKGFNTGFSVGNRQLSYPYDMELKPEEDVTVTISFSGQQSGSTGVRFAGEFQVSQNGHSPFVFKSSACINCADEDDSESSDSSDTEETNDSENSEEETDSTPFVCDADGSSGWLDGYASDPYSCAQYNVEECKYANSYKSTQAEFDGVSALEICCVCITGEESTVETTTAADADVVDPDGCTNDDDWVDAYHLINGGVQYGCHNWYTSDTQGCDTSAPDFENEGKTGFDACCKCKALL